MENLESLKIYELYPRVNDQNYYAIHTLRRLYSDKDSLKYYHLKKLDETFNKIKSIKKFLNEFSICPYLMLNNLNDDKKEKEVFDRIVYEIIPDFQFDNKPKNILKKINPYEDKNFIKRMLFTITKEKNSKQDREDSLKAEKLFYLYGRKEHLPLIIEYLKLVSNLDSLDD